MKLSINSIGYRANDTFLVNDVTIDVKSGGLTAVIGPNGAGKSTLLRVVAGDMPPTAGTVAYGTTSISSLSIAKRALLRSVLPQQHSSEIAFTVYEVVSMGRYPYQHGGLTEDTSEGEAVESAINALDLRNLQDRQVLSLSGGEQQRVAIARIVAQDAPIVLLDEPTTALDIKHQESVMALIADLGARGRTVLAVLHDLNLVSHFDQAVLMHEGRVAAQGAPEDVLTADSLSSVYGHPIDVVEHPTRPGPLVLPRISLPPGPREYA